MEGWEREEFDEMKRRHAELQQKYTELRQQHVDLIVYTEEWLAKQAALRAERPEGNDAKGT